MLKDNKIYLRLFEKGVKIMPNSTTSTEWKAGYACKGDLMGLPLYYVYRIRDIDPNTGTGWIEIHDNQRTYYKDEAERYAAFLNNHSQKCIPKHIH